VHLLKSSKSPKTSALPQTGPLFFDLFVIARVEQVSLDERIGARRRKGCRILSTRMRSRYAIQFRAGLSGIEPKTGDRTMGAKVIRDCSGDWRPYGRRRRQFVALI
jgi:hypothetical protein